MVPFNSASRFPSASMPLPFFMKFLSVSSLTAIPASMPIRGSSPVTSSTLPVAFISRAFPVTEKRFNSRVTGEVLSPFIEASRAMILLVLNFLCPISESGMLTVADKEGIVPLPAEYQPSQEAVRVMVASVCISPASFQMVLLTYFSTSLILHLSTYASPLIYRLSVPANLMSARAFTGIPATSALNFLRVMPRTVSFGNSSPELNLTGTLSLPYDFVARNVVASAPAYILPFDIPILNLSRARATVSDGNLPATNMLSTFRFIRLLSIPSLLILPLNCMRLMLRMMSVVSGTLL